eukprot:gene9439-8450_t
MRCRTWCWIWFLPFAVDARLGVYNPIDAVGDDLLCPQHFEVMCDWKFRLNGTARDVETPHGSHNHSALLVQPFDSICINSYYQYKFIRSFQPKIKSRPRPLPTILLTAPLAPYDVTPRYARVKYIHVGILSDNAIPRF